MTSSYRWLFGLLCAALLLGCSGSCPSARAPQTSRDEWARRLAAKGELSLHATKSLTIKRDVHSFVLAADADVVARTFHEVMRDPARRFGLIVVDRPDAERGKPFQLGSRFQGRYRIEDASELLRQLSRHDAASEAVCEFENQNTSDFGVIRVLELPPDPSPSSSPPSPAPGTTYVLEYHYLAGSPIAGSSRFEVTQVRDHVSRLTQIFTYQEQTLSFAVFFSAGGLTLHEQVLSSQVAQTAAALKTEILETDMPPEYRIP